MIVDHLLAGWKFVPSKFVPAPKEFRIYGNEVRQTLIDNFVIPVSSRSLMKKKKKEKKVMYQSRITKYFD